MVEIFREVRRVLRDDGTLWLNLGDSYWGGKGQSSQAWSTEHTDRGVLQKPYHQITGKNETRPSDGKHDVIKPKDLVGIPWMVAFALRADGWYLRSDIIWKKPNPMPESVTDRPTKAHEYIFLMSKSAKYFYDAEAIKEGVSENTHNQISKTRIEEITNARAAGANTTTGKGSTPKSVKPDGMVKQNDSFTNAVCLPVNSRNKRTVWTIATMPYKEAHFATFPPKLIEPCILAGTSEKGCCAACGAPWERITESTKTFESGSGRSGNPITGKQNLSASGTNSTPDIRMGPTIHTKTIGWQPTCQDRVETRPCTVLDPFAGAGTTLLVSEKYGRKWIGIELNQDYCSMIKNRLEPEIRQRKLF